MKLRRLRKKTRPTQKKVVLFPYENRLEALEKAVQQYNELVEMYKSLVSTLHVESA